MVPKCLRSRWGQVRSWGKVGLGYSRQETRAVTGWAVEEWEVSDIGGPRPGSSHTPATGCSMTLGESSLAWALAFHV